MTHILMIVIFAAMVGVVFGVLGKDERGAQVRYGASVFLKFVGVAFILGWVLYFLPL